jgi:nucleoside-diphosphate-sugar epimerase
MKRIAITGSSGYLGSCSIRYLAQHDPEARILGLDIVASNRLLHEPGFQFRFSSRETFLGMLEKPADVALAGV